MRTKGTHTHPCKNHKHGCKNRIECDNKWLERNYDGFPEAVCFVEENIDLTCEDCYEDEVANKVCDYCGKPEHLGHDFDCNQVPENLAAHEMGRCKMEKRFQVKNDGASFIIVDTEYARWDMPYLAVSLHFKSGLEAADICARLNSEWQRFLRNPEDESL